MSLKATPSDGMRFGVAAGDDMDGLQCRGCLPLHSLRSFRQQVPPVTQMTPSGCFARKMNCPCQFHLNSGFMGLTLKLVELTRYRQGWSVAEPL